MPGRLRDGGRDRPGRLQNLPGRAGTGRLQNLPGRDDSLSRYIPVLSKLEYKTKLGGHKCLHACDRSGGRRQGDCLAPTFLSQQRKVVPPFYFGVSLSYILLGANPTFCQRDPKGHPGIWGSVQLFVPPSSPREPSALLLYTRIYFCLVLFKEYPSEYMFLQIWGVLYV